MQALNIASLKSFVRNIGVTMNEPVMIWGQPGVGKSEALAQVARDLDAVLCDIRLSQYDSVDLRGIPSPQDGMTVWNLPSTLPFIGNPNFPTDRPIILFLDEINGASPATAAVAYQLVNDRAVGEHVLMPNVYVIAAGNRESDKGVTNRMPLPLANRFTHVEAVVDADSWCLHAQDVGVPTVGIAFMQFRKNLLTTFDPAKTDKAFATPRTWMKAFKYYDAKMPDDIKMAAMAGAVGDGPAAEFWGFVDVWQNIVSIKDIIANPKTARLPEQGAMAYATAINISGHLDTSNAAPLHTYLCRMDPEFAVMAWNLALKRDKGLYEVNEFLDYSKRFCTIWTS